MVIIQIPTLPVLKWQFKQYFFIILQLWLITEYMENGSLFDFLSSNVVDHGKPGTGQPLMTSPNYDLNIYIGNLNTHHLNTENI